ncbi:hypothetical protein C8F01DRAFT_1138256 [Mycena amicta]|nr:hypothetical protein C8F01DRAFT_1138256 [Mycena amicta]
MHPSHWFSMSVPLVNAQTAMLLMAWCPRVPFSCVQQASVAGSAVEEQLVVARAKCTSSGNIAHMVVSCRFGRIASWLYAYEYEYE